MRDEMSTYQFSLSLKNAIFVLFRFGLLSLGVLIDEGQDGRQKSLLLFAQEGSFCRRFFCQLRFRPACLLLARPDPSTSSIVTPNALANLTNSVEGIPSVSHS